MNYRKEKDKYILKLKKGESVIDVLKKFAEEVKIQGGLILGIGAISNPTLSYFDTKTKDYQNNTFDGEYELLSCTGNLTIKEGEIFPHIHVVLGRSDSTTVGGHLTNCVISAAGEFFVFPTKEKVKREFDEGTGLFLWDLE